MSNALIVENRDRSMIVRFDRPDVRSPLSVAVVEELQRIVDRVSIFERLIFTGGGNMFASGADLREIALVDAGTAREFALRGQRLMASIADLSCMTIAAVNGFCFGGALDLALACRKRVAAPNAEFAHPGANLGIITGWGGTQRLPRLVGEAAALEMFLTAKRLDAAEAFSIGLVDAVAEDPLICALAL